MSVAGERIMKRVVLKPQLPAVFLKDRPYGCIIGAR